MHHLLEGTVAAASCPQGTQATLKVKDTENHTANDLTTDISYWPRTVLLSCSINTYT